MTRHAGPIRAILLVAIVAAVGASAYLYRQLYERHEIEARGGPSGAAREAIRAADLALVAGDLQTAARALGRARAALDEALSAHPDEPRLLRARLNISDRLGQIAQERGDRAAALPHRREAVELAARLLEREPTEDRARSDRVATARKLADLRRDEGQVDAAGREVIEALEAVEITLRALPGGAPLLAALADAWMQVAADRARAGDEPGAQRALERATAHVEAAARRSSQPLEALGQEHATLTRAAEIFERLERRAEAAEMRARALHNLETQARLEPDEPAIKRSLAAALDRAASRQAAGGDGAARALYGRSLALREQLLALAPKGEARGRARRDLVIGLTHAARFHSRAGRHEEALPLYERAVEVARGLGGAGRWTLVRALGSCSQVLGKLDRMARAKATAAEAWSLASGATAEGPRAAYDAAVAALRHARMLRARPGPDRRAARRIARRGLALLAPAKASGRPLDTLRGGLEALLRELQR